MIIDKIKIAGRAAYFLNPNFQKTKDPATFNEFNLGLQGRNPVISRTPVMNEGKQWEISGVNLILEADDLKNLWNQNGLQPLFSIKVIKEMFPGLLANPYQHRVHNISGFEDFKQGTLEDCHVFEVEGIPTIVSSGKKNCKWTSRIYPMPITQPTGGKGISIVSACWELASVKSTPKTNFTYSLNLHIWDEGSSLNAPYNEEINLAKDYDPPRSRVKEEIRYKSNRKVVGYQIEFVADIEHDASMYEFHNLTFSESLGTPLLRAINLLEPVQSVYEFYSIHELITQASSYQIFDVTGGPIRKMTVNLDLSAVLVHSDYKYKENGIDKDAEYIEFKVLDPAFTYFEAKLIGMESYRPPKF